MFKIRVTLINEFNARVQTKFWKRYLKHVEGKYHEKWERQYNMMDHFMFRGIYNCTFQRFLPYFVLGPSVGFMHLHRGGKRTNHTLVSNWGHKIARFNPLTCASWSILASNLAWFLHLSV